MPHISFLAPAGGMTLGSCGDGMPDALVVDHDSESTSYGLREFNGGLDSGLIVSSAYHRLSCLFLLHFHNLGISKQTLMPGLSE